MRRLANYFLQGLIFLAPIAVTVYAAIASLVLIDGWLNLPIPGLGLLILLGAVTVIGFLVSNIFAGQVVRAVDAVFGKLPFGKLLYGAVKDLLGALVGEHKRFEQPVLVDLIPGGAIQVLGFVARESTEVFELPDKVAVYFPQSYNFAGQVALIDRELVHEMAAERSDVLAFIVSGGISTGSAP